MSYEEVEMEGYPHAESASRDGPWAGQWIRALMTKTALIGLNLAIGIVLPVVGAQAGGGWAAISTDGTGNWGYAIDYPDSRSAASAALRGCGQSGCKLRLSAQKNCLALAESRRAGDYTVGDALAGTQDAAVSRAISECASAAPRDTCRIVKAVCKAAPKANL